jgi:sterol desaturase/sphingolipid hydroxylase (fatty acid hydroxylase superfamily)
MVDLTVVAVPFYFGSMEAERRYLESHAEERGPTAADYDRPDTIANLAMGTASLVAPFVAAPFRKALSARSGRWGRRALAAGLGAAAVTTAADVIARRWGDGERGDDERGEEAGPDRRNRSWRRRAGAAARRVAGVGGVASITTGVVVAASTIATELSPRRMFDRRIVGDLGAGVAATALAVLGWDFIYYWNHRFMHESRFMWAIHVPHHSSEHYNLSVALRQPVADLLGTFVPYGLMSALGIRPAAVETARGLNLIYQYWIHTDVIGKLGRFERWFNTASHHRVHHGSNLRYIDRNHGSILIVWDRLFGTFQEEQEPVVYGLTKNVGSHNVVRIATHEYVDIARDLMRSRGWRERLSYVFRGPGWAYERHAELGLRGPGEHAPLAATA